MGKPKHLAVIDRAWKEYESKNFTLRYWLARARLGNYDKIDGLVAHLQEDYGQDAREDVMVRVGIINVLGTFLDVCFAIYYK